MPGFVNNQYLDAQAQGRAREQSLDQFNQSLRANPAYQAFLQSMGVNPSGPLQLSTEQRKRAEQWVRANVADLGDLEIDPAGNANQNEGFGKQALTYGLPAAGMATALFGIPGLFSGALNGGGAAASGAAGSAGGATTMIPGTGIPTVAGTGAGVTAPITAGAAAGKTLATTAAGTSAIDKLRQSLTSANGIASLASLIPMLAAAGGGGGSKNAGSDELARIQAITEARMRRADPLHQVAVQLAYNRAPISARNGISLQNVTLPQ